MKFAFTLTPAESRRLIARAVARMSEVQRAAENAYIIIIGGTTTAYVVQEILGRRAITPGCFPKGINNRGLLCLTHKDHRQQLSFILHRGKPVDKTITEALKDFHADTVVIKGANAIDADGNVGIIMGNPEGGSVAQFFGAVVSQGLTHIVPVGLEKMIPSVKKAVRAAGAARIDYSMGADFGMYCVSNASVVTEIEALKMLFNVDAVHVASGGVGGSEGAVTIIADGEEKNIKAAIELVELIKGEPRIKASKNLCLSCEHQRCAYHGLQEEQLPKWLQDIPNM